MYRRFRTAPTPWRSLANNAGGRDEDGFTLIELVIVTLVLPLIIGAIALALVSIFSLQGSVSGRLTGSGDAQVVSSNFEKDVQSAALVSAPLQGSSYIAPTNPAPCASAAQSGDPQVLGLQWGGGQTGAMQTEVSYVEVPVVNGSSTTYKLVRNVCQIGSTIPNSTSVVSSNVSSGEQAAVTCAATLSSALTQSTSYSSLSVSPLPVAVTSGDSISREFARNHSDGAFADIYRCCPDGECGGDHDLGRFAGCQCQFPDRVPSGGPILGEHQLRCELGMDQRSEPHRGHPLH